MKRRYEANFYYAFDKKDAKHLAIVNGTTTHTEDSIREEKALPFLGMLENNFIQRYKKRHPDNTLDAIIFDYERVYRPYMKGDVLHIDMFIGNRLPNLKVRCINPLSIEEIISKVNFCTENKSLLDTNVLGKAYLLSLNLDCVVYFQTEKLVLFILDYLNKTLPLKELDLINDKVILLLVYLGHDNKRRPQFIFQPFSKSKQSNDLVCLYQDVTDAAASYLVKINPQTWMNRGVLSYE